MLQRRGELLLLLAGEWVSRALYVAAKLEIADLLEAGPQSVEDLARWSQSDPDSLYRLLQLLSQHHLFEEVAPRVFANTERSALLAKSHPETLRAVALFYGEDGHRAWSDLLPAVQMGRCAFDIAFGQPSFDYCRDNPARGALFQQAMKEKAVGVIRSAISSYDFGQFRSICDIGGGHGEFTRVLLRHYPGLRGTIFDLPEVVAQVAPLDNCRLVAGNFFESVPTGGDGYLLKSVLHDWDDERCVKILDNCRQAMGANSRLLIIEVVLQSLYTHCMDLQMLAVTGGRERDLDSFRRIFERSGFVLERVYPTATEFSILEARPVVDKL